MSGQSFWAQYYFVVETRRAKLPERAGFRDKITSMGTCPYPQDSFSLLVRIELLMVKASPTKPCFPILDHWGIYTPTYEL